MKSKELRTFLMNLSQLNNSFTHYSFVWNQFSIDYNDLIEKNPDDLTKDIFKTNPFARKHNIKLEKLSNEHDKTYKTLIEGIYLLTFSYYESYLKSIMEFACLVDSKISSLDEKLDNYEDDYILIDKVLNRIELDQVKIDSKELKTLNYLRLRRNRITHRNSLNISHSLNDLIKKEGTELNKLWSEKLRTGLQEINFNSKDKVNIINFDFIIDTINILRIIIGKLDTEILNKLGNEKIIKEVVIPKFIKQQKKKLKQFTESRLLRKFRRFCKSEYSIETNDIIEREFLKAV